MDTRPLFERDVSPQVIERVRRAVAAVVDRLFARGSLLNQELAPGVANELNSQAAQVWLGICALLSGMARASLLIQLLNGDTDPQIYYVYLRVLEQNADDHGESTTCT